MRFSILVCLLLFIQVQASLIYPNEEWMKENYEHLKNHTLLEIPFPGTHDSGAYSLTSKWSPGGFGNPSDNSYITLADQYHLQLWKVVKPWSICHSGSIGEQLYYGIRAFDIRAMWDGEWYIHHNLRGVPLRDVLYDIYHFVVNHESEIVILDISHIAGYSKEGYQLRELRALLDTYLHGFYIPSTVVLQNTPISQLIEKNQRVLVHLEDPEAGTKFTDFWNFDTSSEGVYSNTNDLQKMIAFNNKQLMSLGGHHKFVITFWTLTPMVTDFIYSIVPCLSKHETLLSMATETGGTTLKEWMEAKKQVHPGNLVYVDHFKEVDIVNPLIRFIQRDCYDDYEHIARRADQTDCRSIYEQQLCGTDTPLGREAKQYCKLTCNECDH